MGNLTDTHCHLYAPDFRSDLNKVLKDAESSGVNKILIPGFDLETSKKTIDISESEKNYLYAAIGIHPNSNLISKDSIFSLKTLLKSKKVIAIGEIGLDFYRHINSMEDQVAILRSMLDLAAKNNLPICIHNRDSDDEMIRILDKWFNELLSRNSILVEHPGVFHSFDGSIIISRWALEHNFFLGIGGPITYKNNKVFHEVIQEIDMTHFLLETDAPYLSPHPFRGKRNEPKNVKIIAEKIAELKNLSLSDVIEATCLNARTLFNW